MCKFHKIPNPLYNKPLTAFACQNETPVHLHTFWLLYTEGLPTATLNMSQSNLNKHWSFISADINAFVALKINQHLTIQVHYIILHYITSHHVPFDSITLHYITHVHVIIHHACSLSGYVALPGETWPISTTVCSKRAKERQKTKRKVLRTNYKFSLQIYCPSPQCLVCKSLKLCNAVHIIVDTRCWAKWNCVYRISSIL